ncbi:MAG TPA: sulfatase-like hydrolase/transferase, partial [Spirochaetota bacterium]|nr:sulfatase-like hydrolase/transferase [Spirochaetota bacterium]
FTVFDRMYSLGTKTRISVAGFLTSTLPPQTGHGYNYNLVPDEVKNRFYRDSTITSLPRVLGDNGYLTFQVGNCGFTNPALPTSVDYGFDESFEFQKYPYDSTGIAFHLIRTLRAHKGTPFYCYAHLNTTHKPRITPAKYYFTGYLSNPSLMWRPNVTGAARYADHLFSLIIDSLKKEGLWDNSIVIISSDHGTLYEIDNYNRNFLLEDFVKIPFLLHVPDSLKKNLGDIRPRVSESTTLLNLAPTVLDLLGIRSTPEFKGKSVKELLGKKDPRGYTDENIFVYDTFAATILHQGRWKYTLLEYDRPEGDEFRVMSHHFFGSGMSDCRESLSDIMNDPLEKTNLISVNKDITSYMRRLFSATEYHPYMYVLSLHNKNKSDSMKAEITVRNGSIYHADADNVPIKFTGGTITHVFAGKGTSRITFGADRSDAVVSVRIVLNGKTLPSESFLSGEYALPLSGNPAVFSGVSDRFALLSNGLYSTEALSSRLKSSCAVIVMKDYRRWIREAGKGADNGANTNMKQVLKSWGYIQ